MAQTQFLTRNVEEYVRQELERQFGQPFGKLHMPIDQRSDGLPATHEFDAVSADGQIVADIKSSTGKTSSGKYPSGKVAVAYKDLYFLSLVKAKRRILVLTDPDFYEIFESNSDGKLMPGLELMLVPLPPELQRQAQLVHQAASQEMSGGVRS